MAVIHLFIVMGKRNSKPVSCIGMVNGKKPIYSYRDLDVYQSAYAASIKVMLEILPKLPDSERFDLKDQLSRSCKAVPRLIAEGYAKKHQRAGFQKYLDDAMAEANETCVGLSQCRDIYHRYMDARACDELIDIYDKIGRQLFKLEQAWNKFKRITPINDNPKDDTGRELR